MKPGSQATLSSLELRPAFGPYPPDWRNHAMFWIDGVRFDTMHGDLDGRISPICKEFRSTDPALGQLLLTDAPEMREGRRPVLVCHECGDVDCGAIGVRITRHGDEVEWADFVLDVNYASPDHPIAIPVGPFRFKWTDYEAAIRKAAEEVKTYGQG